MGATRIKGIDHVALIVRDIESSLAYFTGQLGLPVLRDEVTAASGGARLVFLDAGNVAIQLVCPTGPEGPMAEHLATHGDGLHHICLTVDNIDASLAALAPDAGVPVAIGGRGRRTAFLPGRPGGLVTELAEVPSVEGGASNAEGDGVSSEGDLP